VREFGVQDAVDVRAVIDEAPERWRRVQQAVQPFRPPERLDECLELFVVNAFFAAS
jgi:hypothetical protein